MPLVALQCVVDSDSGHIESIHQEEHTKTILCGEQVRSSYNKMVSFADVQAVLREEDISKYQKRINTLQQTVIEMQQRVDETNSIISSCVNESVNNCSKIVTERYTNEHARSLTKILESMKEVEREVSLSMKTKSTKQVGAEGEQFVIQSIQQLYPQWCIEDTHGSAEAGDFHSFIDREEGSWILNEVKTHKSSVRTAEVNKFYRDIDKHRPPMAIMYSLYSNIVGKPHGHYENRNNTHIYFVSYVRNNPQCVTFVHRVLLRQWKETKGTSQISSKKESTDELQQKVAIVEQQNRKKHMEVNTCIEYMIQRDQLLIQQCKKEISQHTSSIKHKKNVIKETEQHMKEYTARQFELGMYINTDEESRKKYAYQCKRCSLFFTTKAKLWKHIGSQKHFQM